MTKRICFAVLLCFPLFAAGQHPGFKRSVETREMNGRTFYLHFVLKGQTLYAISKTYEVPLDTIYQYNPDVKKGMKAGQYLYIPQPVKIRIVPGNTDTTVNMAGKGVGEPEMPCEQGFHRGPLNLALLMPLYLSDIDSIPSEAYDPTNEKEIKPLRFIQFYEGFLMAVDSLVNMGLSVNIHVYDVDDDSLKTRKLLRDPVFRKMDLMIGLLYGQSFHEVAMFCRQHQIPLVNPLSNKRNHIENNPLVFLVNPSVQVMAQQIAAFITRRYSECVILMLNSGKETEKRSMQMIYREIVNAYVLQHRDTANIYQFSGEKNLYKIPGLIAGKSKNVVVVLTNDELFVVSVLRQIRNWSQVHSFMVFGMPGWLDFKSVESATLVDLNFHSFSTSFVDYTTAPVKQFVMQFREKYKTEPQELAFQGFDVGYYFLSAFLYYDRDFIRCIPKYRYEGLQSRFILDRTGDDGYENHWLNIYQFENYQVINARK
ncbi:MAG TPA: LysM domain-containing protein [Bacteroidales bacterium]|nr:LysM domain-containing protein [Bacteroidales bacterium]HSA42798.1 LysM domain-containing protein [Bacteroidales bacterium]